MHAVSFIEIIRISPDKIRITRHKWHRSLYFISDIE